ncbi:MAG: sugar phosphate isomerase/epimerase family protein, partial [Pseudomonadota bacterium]
MRPLTLDRCSLNTATLGHRAPLGEVIDAVAGAGFGAIAPWRRDLEGLEVGAVARRVRDAGLAVSGLCRSTYLPAADRAGFLANVEDNRRALDQAAALEAACFVMVVGSLPAGSRDLAEARTQVEEGTAMLLEHARSVGVPLALEPLHPMYAGDRACLNTLAQALDVCERLEPEPGRAPWLGVAIDAYHVWWDPDLQRHIVRAGAGRRILALHVCDWRLPTRDLLTDRSMMGDGVIDLRQLRGSVEDAGYTGGLWSILVYGHQAAACSSA